jgi:hypothetical protein
MGAGIGDGKEVAVYIEKGNLLSTNFHQFPLPWLQVLGFRYLRKTRHLKSPPFTLQQRTVSLSAAS